MPGALGAGAIELVEVDRGGRLAGIALRRQADPEHRHVGALERGDGRVDALHVSGLPGLALELQRPGRRLRLLLLGRGGRRRLCCLLGSLLHFGVLLGGAGLRAALRRIRILKLGIVLRRRLRRVAPGRRRRRTVADRLPVVEADHHHDELGLIRRDRLAHDLRPFHIAPRIVADETRIGPVLAHDAELRLFGERVFQAIGEPVGHRVAQHQNRRRDRRGGFRLSGAAPAAPTNSPPSAPLSSVPADRRRSRRTDCIAVEVAARAAVGRADRRSRTDSRIAPRPARSIATLINATADALASARMVLRDRKLVRCTRLTSKRTVMRPILRQKCQLEDKPLVIRKSWN